MKVVLIAESEDTINEYTAFLEQAGADVITYRWFLKALDNLTEIQPHIIIVSALDFPRHWKTIFTHIEAGAFKNQPLVYLITDPSFTASEKKKAMFLGAQDIFLSPLTNRDKNSLLSMLPAGMGIEVPVRAPAVSEEAAAEPSQPVSDAPSFDAPAEPEIEETAAAPSFESEPEPEPLSENEPAMSEYEALQAQAATATADVDFIDDTVIPPSVSLNDFPAADDIPTNDDLIVASADEDILTKIEGEMTIKEIPDELKETPAPAPEPEPEPEPAPAPSIERPEQITWSAPIDDEPAPQENESHPSFDDPAATVPSFDEPAESYEEAAEEEEGFVTFSFVNPSTGMVVTGNVESYDHPTIKFTPDSRDAITGIRFGQILEQCKFSFEGETLKVRAQVRGLGKVIEFCLLY